MSKLTLHLSILLLAGAAWSQKPAANLPKVFSGWELRSHRVVNDAAGAVEGTESAPLLREYGFESAESAVFTRDGESMPVEVLHFKDAIGAYGAFTALRTPAMEEVQICDGGASRHGMVLFECSNLVVKATVPRPSSMTASEMRDFAALLPRLSGQANEPPSMAQFLPAELRGDAKYVVGPESWKAAEVPVPAAAVDFDRYHPEVLLTQADPNQGGTVTLLKYPTPQIAQLEIKRLNDWRTAEKRKGTFILRRSGPLVAIILGDVLEEQAKILAERIHYEADVSWNEQTSVTPRNNIGNLVYNILVLAFLIGGFGIFVGIMLGGLRVMLKRFFPDRFIDRPEDVEFIRLKLND